MTCGYYWNPRRSNALEPFRERAVGGWGPLNAPECAEHLRAGEAAAALVRRAARASHGRPPP